MKVEEIEPLGARVTELEVGALAPEETEQLRELLAARGVLVVPDQEIDDDAFLAFLRSFGEMAFTKGEKSLDGYPDLNFVTNVGRTKPPKSQWHVDTSYISQPPAYTSLRGVEIPERGGETLFSNQYRAFETLDPELREYLEGRSIRHVVTGVELGPDDESEAEHLIFRPHPRTGEVALYLSTPDRCREITGVSAEETKRTVALLLEHSTTEDNVYRHQWQAGDVVIWDNACVLHRADHSGVEGARTMHRGMVASH